MGKITGFLDYERKNSRTLPPAERLKNFREFHIPLEEEEQERQGARCMDCGVPFCQSGCMLCGMTSGCPLNNLCPEWNDALYHSNWDLAFRRLLKTNAFPEFTGRVCPALCEAACTCGLHGPAVSIRENELSIIEHAFTSGTMKAKPPRVRTGKKVAVIGSGPAGLSAAYWLNQRGHSVTVYERSDRIGGLLMYGIPNMKLDKAVIERRRAMLEAEGITFITGADVGKDSAYAAAKLKKEYDSIILACGASNPRDIKAPGRESEGIFFAVDYLSRTTKTLLDTGFQDNGGKAAAGKQVIVIGGGDTGNDCVGTVLRQGAKSVVQLEMMPKPPAERTADNSWPEWPRVLKTDYGQEEAASLFGSDPRVYQTTVKEFKADKNGKLKSLVTIALKPQRDEKTGRMNMVPVEGSEKELKADLVLIAAGFLGAQSYVADAFSIKLSPRTTIEASDSDYMTSDPKVFACGDVRRGQSLVVWALHEGYSAARSVDEKLMGYTGIE